MSTTRGKKKKQRWFDLGVEAISRVTGQRVPGYVCPLCARPWSSIDDVSFEHAPTRGLGAERIAVTCRACNSTAGPESRHESGGELAELVERRVHLLQIRPW
jgi:hypothetical protein